MASFLYYLPAVSQSDIAQDGRLVFNALQPFGLSEVLADCSFVPDHVIVTPTPAGPDKQPGIVLTPHPTNAAGSIPRMPAYDPDSQTWWRIGKGENEPWIGFQTDSPPTAEDLQRRDAVGGYRRADEHGRSWVIPVLRGRESQYGMLPVDYDWSDGKFEPGMILRATFQELWDLSSKIWDHLYVENYNVPEPFIVAFVARCFAVNYRIGPRELDAFRRLGKPLFDRASLNEWAALSCDYPAIVEYAAKKKMTVFQAARDGMRSSAGDPAGTVDIDQVAANSA